MIQRENFYICLLALVLFLVGEWLLLEAVWDFFGNWSKADIAAWLTAIFTLAIAFFARQQLKDQVFRQRQWATLQICDRYDQDATLRSSLAIMRKVYHNDTKLLNLRGYEIEAAYRNVFNYFDSISIGLQQGLYIPEIVDEHLKQLMIEHWDWLNKSDNQIVVDFKNKFPECFQTFFKKLSQWNNSI